VNAAVARPGDTVLIRLDEHPTDAEATQLKDQLARLMPGVSFALMARCEVVAVYRVGEEPTT
jgi:hypothetical protein